MFLLPLQSEIGYRFAVNARIAAFFASGVRSVEVRMAWMVAARDSAAEVVGTGGGS